MICPYCKKTISGANKCKVKGVWYHKVCPKKKGMVVMKRATPGFSTLEIAKKKYRRIRLRGKTHNKVVNG